MFTFSNRPIAPHLLVYSPQLSSLFSIWHRITGVILASVISIILLIVKSFTISNFYDWIIFKKIFVYFNYISWLSSYAYLLVLFFLLYHMLNGTRHIIWDLVLFLNINSIRFSSIILLFILSLVLVRNII